MLYLEIEDKEGYDTTVGTPTNLPDGIYILQTAMLVGNGFGVYYSCGNLSITGGNPRWRSNNKFMFRERIQVRNEAFHKFMENNIE